MDAQAGDDVTALLAAWRCGDSIAATRLLPLVHERLRRLARHLMNSERPHHTLQPTELINELFMRMVDRPPSCTDREHFFRIASRMMNHVLVDHARRMRAAKRGGDLVKVPLEPDLVASDPRYEEERLDLELALTELEALNPRQHQIFWLINAAGLTAEHAGVVAGVSETTAKRDNKVALAFVRRKLSMVEVPVGSR